MEASQVSLTLLKRLSQGGGKKFHGNVRIPKGTGERVALKGLEQYVPSNNGADAAVIRHRERS